MGISKTIVVALQNVGGAIGNMICVHNVIAACATVGLIGVEGIIIKRNLIPVFILCNNSWHHRYDINISGCSKFILIR